MMTTPRTGGWRSQEHRSRGGVCGGIAEWLGWSPTTVRIAASWLVSSPAGRFRERLVSGCAGVFVPEREAI